LVFIYSIENNEVINAGWFSAIAIDGYELAINTSKPC